MKSSFASISKTLHHLADAQVVWLKRLKGVLLNVPSGNFNGSKEELFRKLLGSSEELVQLMRSRDDDNLKSKIFVFSPSTEWIFIVPAATSRRGMISR